MDLDKESTKGIQNTNHQIDKNVHIKIKEELNTSDCSNANDTIKINSTPDTRQIMGNSQFSLSRRIQIYQLSNLLIVS